ncbi:hypothetical protein C8J57DRAFT_1615066 [Mycena rebaudengoi]|nr:hypothetical protein C8J57DRAFT_1615066 [Mycena rebaudengoi]
MPTQRISRILSNISPWPQLLHKTLQKAKVPFLGSAAALCLSITKSVQPPQKTIRSNKEEYVEILGHIHEILCIIVQLDSTSEIRGVLPTALLYDIAKFTESLEKVFTPEAGERLETCKQELNRMVGLFKAQVTGSTLSQMGQMKKDAKEQHEELVALLEKDSTLTGSDRSSMAGTLPSLKNNRIFWSTSTLPQNLQWPILHIAILGAGGMGKTSATAALHNPQVEAKYSDRYFPCHSPLALSWQQQLQIILGWRRAQTWQRRLHIILPAPPSLLVLDNLETPWEALSARSEVEEFLSLLTDAPHLGLMITLRGAEHPSKVKWTRPFLAPLKPLSNVAARQTFIEGIFHWQSASLQVLLIEGCAKALSRWKLESTRMLSDGYDQRSSLDISIMLSYTSSRMTPGAQELLSLLSMLPDGLADADLVQAKLPIPDILSCKATLIQTALAFVGQDQHSKSWFHPRTYP